MGSGFDSSAIFLAAFANSHSIALSRGGVHGLGPGNRSAVCDGHGSAFRSSSTDVTLCHCDALATGQLLL